MSRYNLYLSTSNAMTFSLSFAGVRCKCDGRG